MSLFPDVHGDEFSVMVDPFTGRIALICPAPIITFDDVNEFKSWLSYLLDTVPDLTRALVSVESEPAIDKDYAVAVIDIWQKQIVENLKISPKKSKIKKPAKKQKNSMNGE